MWRWMSLMPRWVRLLFVSLFQAMEANNKFTATLEKHLHDVPRSDELYEIKKIFWELKLSLKVAQDWERANTSQLAAAEKLGNQARLWVVGCERKLALEQISLLDTQIESSLVEHADSLCWASYEADEDLKSVAGPPTHEINHTSDIGATRDISAFKEGYLFNHEEFKC